MDRFLAEVDHIQRLRHSGILPVQDILKDETGLRLEMHFTEQGIPQPIP